MKIRSTIATATLLVSASAFAATFPEGSFKGHGLWKSASGQSGSYTASTTVSVTALESQYELSNATQREFKADIEMKSPNFFVLKSVGVPIGSGYCLERAVVCHYQLNAGETALEETITLQDGKFYRFGSKGSGESKVMWQEALSKQ